MAISSENMARLPMSKLRRLNNGSQAEEIQGQSNECDDSSGLCDDSVCLKWFWNGLFCIFFRESPQIDSFFCRISSVTMSPKSSQSFCRDSFDSAWRALRSVWNCPLNTAYKNNGSRNFGKSPQQEASLFMLRVLSPESSFTYWRRKPKNVRLLLMAFPGSENVVPIEINERLFMLVESVDGNETELLNFEFFDSLYLLGLVMNLI